AGGVARPPPDGRAVLPQLPSRDGPRPAPPTRPSSATNLVSPLRQLSVSTTPTYTSQALAISGSPSQLPTASHWLRGCFSAALQNFFNFFWPVRFFRRKGIFFCKTGRNRHLSQC